jgi:hypothetical protein
LQPQAEPVNDEDESFDEAAGDPLPVVLKVENCSVCFLLAHLGQAMGAPLDITSFS